MATIKNSPQENRAIDRVADAAAQALAKLARETAVTRSENDHLEPRVAKLEGTMETIALNMRDLTALVREQGTQMENQIQGLLVGVTNAAAPRKTDWNTLIAAVCMVLTIGAATLSPLYLKIGTLEHNHEDLDVRFQKHIEQDAHPVGLARINQNAKAITDLDAKLQKEYELVNNVMVERLGTLNVKIEDTRVNGSIATRERLAVLEEKARVLELHASEKVTVDAIANAISTKTK